MSLSNADYTGVRIGKLTVLFREENSKKWLCQCDCGKTVYRTGLCLGRAIRNEAKSSCGCQPPAKTHGLSMTHKKLHWVWVAMKQRCDNPSNKDFACYGGRGIKVCREWYEFENFYNWAKSTGYHDGVTIERRDVNSGYSPENCTWIVNERQADNRQNSIQFCYNGENLTIRQIADLTGLNYLTLRSRLLRYGWTLERAITELAFVGKNQTFKGEK